MQLFYLVKKNLAIFLHRDKGLRQVTTSDFLDFGMKFHWIYVHSVYQKVVMLKEKVKNGFRLSRGGLQGVGMETTK